VPGVRILGPSALRQNLSAIIRPRSLSYATAPPWIMVTCDCHCSSAQVLPHRTEEKARALHPCGRGLSDPERCTFSGSDWLPAQHQRGKGRLPRCASTLRTPKADERCAVTHTSGFGREAPIIRVCLEEDGLEGIGWRGTASGVRRNSRHPGKPSRMRFDRAAHHFLNVFNFQLAPDTSSWTFQHYRVTVCLPGGYGSQS